MDEISSSPSPSFSSTTPVGGPAIDRHNPLIRDPRRISKLLSKPQAGDKKNDQSGDGFNKETLRNHEEKTWSRSDDFISPPGSPDIFSTPLADIHLVAEDYKDANIQQQQQQQETPSFSPSPPPMQVVVMRVSLHCRGCERKIRKHISKMEGVSSFNIDFAAKSVMIAGNITPLSVVSSISRVKNAHLSIEQVSSCTQGAQLQERG